MPSGISVHNRQTVQSQCYHLHDSSSLTMASCSWPPCGDSQKSAASVRVLLANLMHVTSMVVQRHVLWQKQVLARAGFGPDQSSFLPLLQNLISSRSKATVCSPLAVCICMQRAHANKYLEPDAELGQLGVATCQQLLQACELGLLSFCAAWLLHTHSKHHH